jgi:transposase InsO family protein
MPILNPFTAFWNANVSGAIASYNNRRIHGSLIYHSPAEYLRLYQQGIIKPGEIAV